ncbi:hypothetical protein ACJJTC_016021 [Scirpophaga incertulas]
MALISRHSSHYPIIVQSVFLNYLILRFRSHVKETGQPEDDQYPSNISPIPTTSNRTVNEQPNASPATSPSIFRGIGFQPEVVQEEATKNPTPTASTSRAKPERVAGHETHTARCYTTPSKSEETNTDNVLTVNDFINIINNISPMPQHISN